MVLFIIIDQSYVSFTFVFFCGYCLRAFRFHVCSFTYCDCMRTSREGGRGEHTHTHTTDRKVQTLQMKHLHFAFPYFYHGIIMTIFSFIEFIPSFFDNSLLCFAVQFHSTEAQRRTLKRMVCNSKSHRVSSVDGHLWKSSWISIFGILLSLWRCYVQKW